MFCCGRSDLLPVVSRPTSSSAAAAAAASYTAWRLVLPNVDSADCSQHDVAAVDLDPGNTNHDHTVVIFTSAKEVMFSQALVSQSASM